MRLAAPALIGALSLLVAGAANASPSISKSETLSSNIVPIVAGCKLGFHPAYYGCAPNRIFRAYRPFPRDYIEEWDEYDYY